MFIRTCYRGPNGHCLGLSCIYNFSLIKIIKILSVAGAHVQRLVSLFKIATVLEGCTTEEERLVVRFLWAKELDAKHIH
jgi:hypothetical protein